MQPHVTLKYGPYACSVTDESSLFASATELLQQATPRLQLCQDSEAQGPPSTEEGFTRIPVVRLPEDIVLSLCSETEGEDEVSLLGRPSLEVYSHTYQRHLSITNWAMWEATRNVLYDEYLSNAASKEENFSLELTIIIIWLEEDTLHKLYYEDVCDEEDYLALHANHIDNNNGNDNVGYSDAVNGLPPTNTSRNIFDTSATPRDGSPTGKNDNRIEEGDDGIHNSVNTTNNATGLSASIIIVDKDNVTRGHCILPLLGNNSQNKSYFSFSEFVELVKSACGVRRHRHIKIAYCIVNPNSNNNSNSNPTNSGSRVTSPSSGAAVLLSGSEPHYPTLKAPHNTTNNNNNHNENVICSPLRLNYLNSPSANGHLNSGSSQNNNSNVLPYVLTAIEGADDMETFLQDVVLHGCKNTRLVVAESTRPVESVNTTTNISVTSMTTMNSVSQVNTTTPPLTSREEGEKFFDDRFTIVPSCIIPSSPSDGAHRYNCGPPPAVTAAPPPYRREERNIKAPSMPLSEIVPRSSPPPPPPNNNNNTGSSTVIVRYEVDPTELYISGPVSPAALFHLSNMVYTLCSRYLARRNYFTQNNNNNSANVEEMFPFNRNHKSEERSNRSTSSFLPPRFRQVIDTTHRDDNTYVLELHDYHFTTEEEEELEVCVAEAMTLLEGFERIPDTNNVSDSDPRTIQNISAIS